MDEQKNLSPLPVTPGTLEMTAMFKNLDKIEFMNFVLYEKKDPIYKSEILGLPAWGIAAGILLFKLFKKYI